MGKQNNTVKFVVPVFRCSGVFRCFGVFQCSGVLVHAVHSGCVTRKRSSRIPVFLCNRHTGVIEHSRHPLLVDVKGGGGGGGERRPPKTRCSENAISDLFRDNFLQEFNK